MVDAKLRGRGQGTRYRLASDVRIVPEADLPDEVLDGLDRDGRRFVLVRPGSRTGPLLVDSDVAALLKEFTLPAGIVEALIRFSKQRQRDPQEVLRETFETLRLLIERRYLIDADDPLVAGPETRSLEPGDHVGDLIIVRPLQRMEDTEVFQVRLADRRLGALKIASRGSSPAAGGLGHEATVLRLLDGDPTPGLLGTGEYEGRRYLVIEWRTGSDPLVVAEGWRRDGAGAREHLQDISCRILEAYGRLHRRGVVHGDVNARNVLVDRWDRVTLLDFEYAAPAVPELGIGPPSGRAGVPSYLEPEYAKAELDDESPPPATPLGEQYSLAALVYQILVGRPYLEFDPRRRRLLGQIVERSPEPFADRGAPPWPAAEEILARALSKTPGNRFGSVDDMAAALAAAEPPDPTPRRRSSTRARRLEEVIDHVVGKAGPGGAWAAEAATSGVDSTVYRGAAGVAVALYRISGLSGDAALLDSADGWIGRAIEVLASSADDEGAPGGALLVGSAGVHLVDAMIAAALDQSSREERALVRSLLSVGTEPPGSDPYDGRSGRLLAMASVLDRFGTHPAMDRRALKQLGRQAVHRLWSDLDRRPPVADTIGDLGMAHGWAGHLFSTIRWSRAVGAPPPAGLERRLHELADQSVPVGRGLMWPWRLPLGGPLGPHFTAGWCNGSAGYVLLWTAAAQILEDEWWLELACGAAWNAWESAQRDGSLCCGLVGRAYALLHLFRQTGDEIWVDRARGLGEIAVDDGAFDDGCPWGLFQGQLGLALLAADLRNPDGTWFPFMA